MVDLFKSINRVAIICSDYQKSRHFYVSILGLEIIAQNYRAERNSFKLDLKLPHDGQIELFPIADSPVRPSYPEARGLRHLA